MAAPVPHDRLSYALFGDNDFTTRIPAALLSVVSLGIAMLAFRRYLGRTGAILAGLMFLISPIMLFYGRYARNESYIIVWGLLTLYSTLRYLETARPGPCSFSPRQCHPLPRQGHCLYVCRGGVHLPAGLFVDRMARRDGPSQQTFILSVEFDPGDCTVRRGGCLYLSSNRSYNLYQARRRCVGAAVAALVWSGMQLVQNFGWAGLKSERSLNMLILLGTLFCH